LRYPRAFRSGGERGADVESLRGTAGPDFEAEAIINRGGPGGCGCLGGSSAKEQLLLIKGPFIFVFGHESDKAPKYAISLAMMKAKSQKGTGGNYLVSLETTLGDVEYEISFKTEAIAKEFVEAVKKQASIGETEQIRKVRKDNQCYPSMYCIATRTSQNVMSSMASSASVTKVSSRRDHLYNTQKILR
jgi:hypothetical protein